MTLAMCQRVALLRGPADRRQDGVDGRRRLAGPVLGMLPRVALAGSACVRGGHDDGDGVVLIGDGDRVAARRGARNVRADPPELLQSCHW